MTYASVGKSYLVFDSMFINKYEFQSNYWIGMIFYQKISNVLFYIQLKFLSDRTYENNISVLVDLEFLFLFYYNSFIIFQPYLGFFLPIINMVI
jgi:hypothetical protein